MDKIYNKQITLKPVTSLNPDSEFDVTFFTYNGKITELADYFNRIKSETKINELVNIPNRDKSPLIMSAFLGFSNVFLYLLSYGADPYFTESHSRNIWHNLSYRGETKILELIFNYERMTIKLASLEEIETIKRSFGFSKLDIVKGELSRAVNKTEQTIKKFDSFVTKLKQSWEGTINATLSNFGRAFKQTDKEGRNPLHYAAMSNFSLCYQIVNLVLDYNFFDLNGWEEFLEVYKDIQAVEVKEHRLFDPRKSLRMEREIQNLLGEKELTRLRKIFENGKRKLLKEIINMQDHNGDSVLHVSSYHGDYRIVHKLLSCGGDPMLQNDQGKIPVDLAKDNKVRNVMTSLNKAAKNGDSVFMKELVHFGHDINKKLTIFTQAPIHKAVESNKENKYEVLKETLDMGSDPDIRDSNGWTALHYACQFGDLKSVQILVENKATVDCFSNNKRTPLHLASYKNYPNIVNYLLEKEADPNFGDSEKCTPLHLAAKAGNIECLKLLLASGSELYALDFRSWNILHYASFHGQKPAVRFIAKYDCDYDKLLTQRNSQNKLPIEITRDPSVKPYFVSLWHAAKKGDLDMTRLLLNAGEEINDQSKFLKLTALHMAVLNNHYLLVRLLLEKGADPSIRNEDGVTAPEYASLLNRSFHMDCDKIDNHYLEVELRSFVKNLLAKNDNVINSIVPESNIRVQCWKLLDFSDKIDNLLKG